MLCNTFRGFGLHFESELSKLQCRYYVLGLFDYYFFIQKKKNYNLKNLFYNQFYEIKYIQ